MGFDHCRLQLMATAALQAPQVAAPHRAYSSASVPLRSRPFRLRAVASVGFLRRTTAILVALTTAMLISLSPAGLADTLDVPSQYATLGPGSATCFTVIKGMGKTAQFKEGDGPTMLAWAQGYLSFYNSVSEGTYDITDGAGSDALREWLSEFCRNNPQASLMNAR